MDAMIHSTVHRRRVLKGAAGTSFRDVGSLREDLLKYASVLSVDAIYWHHQYGVTRLITDCT
jgi:hypothetical protein